MDESLQDSLSPEKEKNSHDGHSQGEIDGFPGFSEEDIEQARQRGEDLIDKYRCLTQHAPLPSKASEDAKVKERPKMGTGSSSRVKIYLLDVFPSEGLSYAKIPKGVGVMARFFYHLLQVVK